MDFVNPRGDQDSQVFFIGYQPNEGDAQKGYVFAGTDGFYLDKWCQEAGLPLPYYVTLQPAVGEKNKLPDNLCFQVIQQLLDNKKPPIIITCDSRKEKGEKQISDVLMQLCPETKGELSKYAGSLLHSPYLGYPHYVLPVVSPEYIFSNFSEKDVLVSIDFARAKEEIDYVNQNGKLQPLPERTLITEPSFNDLMYFFKSECRKPETRFLSTDIETIRKPKGSTKTGKNKSDFADHPGYPYTLSFATSPMLGISFSLWDYEIAELMAIWREIDWLLKNIPQIGQNYFMFDVVFLEALGFRPHITMCEDTLIRHHILWPELPHSLQFQTRQYTRQPYYKDEGKNWNPKYKKQLMKYNALDTTVTYEVWEAQELEFEDRPHLKGDRKDFVCCS